MQCVAIIRHLSWVSFSISLAAALNSHDNLTAAKRHRTWSFRPPVQSAARFINEKVFQKSLFMSAAVIYQNCTVTLRTTHTSGVIYTLEFIDHEPSKQQIKCCNNVVCYSFISCMINIYRRHSTYLLNFKLLWNGTRRSFEWLWCLQTRLTWGTKRGSNMKIIYHSSGFPRTPPIYYFQLII